MNTPIIVWLSVIGMFAMFLIIRVAIRIIRHFHGIHPSKIISIGSEREEFFVPGDISLDDSEYDD